MFKHPTSWVRLGQFVPVETAPPEVPEDLSALSDEDLGQLHEELEAYLAIVRAEAKTLADAEALRPVAASILALRTEADGRINGPARLEESLAELDASLAIAEPEPAPVVEPPTPEPAPAVEPPAPAPVVAAVPALPALPATPAPAPAIAEPLRPAVTITASGDIPGFATGEEMPGLLEVAKAVIAKREAIGKPGPGVGSDFISVATAHAEFGEERYLRQGDSPKVLKEKIDSVTSPDALVASGGLCAPVQPYYDIMTLAEAVRPVRDGLASFQADRGGITLVPPPQLSDAAGSIGFITAAVDAAALGGNGGQIAAATKPCLHVTCPTKTEYDVAAISRCLEFGNFTARAYPEQVEAWLTLATAQQARKAETALLDGISAKSTQVTAAKVVGAARDLVAVIVKAAAYYRNRNRMSPTRPLRAMLPAWVIDLMVADLTHGSGYEAEFFAMARNQIQAALAELDVNVTFYLDSGTGKGQLINSGNIQTAGALVAFPSTVVWYLFAEGSFLYLDAGTLDFGVVRDSSLNALNNYRIFAETFETVAFVGVESLEITQTVVADGTYAGAAYGLGASTALPASY